MKNVNENAVLPKEYRMASYSMADILISVWSAISSPGILLITVSILQAVVSCSFACKIKKLIFTSRYVLLGELGFLLLARKEHIVKNHCPGLEPRTGAWSSEMVLKVNAKSLGFWATKNNSNVAQKAKTWMKVVIIMAHKKKTKVRAIRIITTFYAKETKGHLLNVDSKISWQHLTGLHLWVLC